MKWLRRLFTPLAAPELPTKAQTAEMLTILKRQTADLQAIADALARQRKRRNET